MQVSSDCITESAFEVLMKRQVAKVVHSDIVSMKKVSCGKISVEMCTYEAANNLVTNPDLIKGYSIFIPTFKIMRSDIIRGVPTSVTDQELKLNLKSSCPVTEIKRLNRRVVKEGGVEYTPSTSVNIKFAGQILPRQVFLFYDSHEVLPFVPRVKTCFSCFRVGHIRKVFIHKLPCIDFASILVTTDDATSQYNSFVKKLKGTLNSLFPPESRTPKSKGAFINNALTICAFLDIEGAFDKPKLSGKEHLKTLVNKGRNLTNILAVLAGTKWGSHPSLLLTLYRAVCVFRSAIEYGCRVFKLKGNKTEFLQLERLVNRNLRLALGYRLSTPINVIMAEAKETPLNIRFGYMTSKFIYKAFSRKNSPVLHSFESLKQAAYSHSRKQRALATVPAFKNYNHSLNTKFQAHLDHCATFKGQLYDDFDIGVNILTEQAVVNEITNKRQLRKLIVLPYDLKVQEAFSENIKFVTEFSKKSGDYISLSATDLKVIALTYQLEKEKVGSAHLKEIPTIRIIKSITDKESRDDLKLPVGFYMPKKKIIRDSAIDDTINGTEINNVEKQFTSYTAASSDESQSDYETASDKEDDKTNDLADKFFKLKCNPTDLEVESMGMYAMDDILTSVDTSKSDESFEDKDKDDDDSSWITPANVSSIKKQMDSEILEEKAATVACLTMDFAMQNVLMQMGLNVVALDGRVIKQMRTFIFRCYACFKTTSIMTKIFCPHCGNRTLKKVEVTLDENGKQQIHINFRRSLSAKGKRFSLPTPKGGKHANNPILCADQPMPKQRPSRLARKKNDPLDDDYIAGYSPFVMRDINSKSAMLGIRPDGIVKYWMKRNPNESKKRRK
ncbi:NOB1 protein, partial [Acromyrmex heyeri]